MKSFAFTVLLALVGCTRIFSDEGCEDVLITTIESFTHEALLVQRNCGATTDYSTLMMLRDKASSSTGEKPYGEIVYSRTGQVPVRMSWTRNEVLNLDANEASPVFTKRDSWRDIMITYQRAQ